MGGVDSATGERILVADDEVFISDVLATSLRYVGFDVDVAAGGREALSKAASFGPDLILLDVNLPDLDGFEVCRRLRAAGDETPIVFLSARREAADRVTGFGHGGDDYVVKPFVLEEVVARVRAILKRAGKGVVTEGDTLTCGDLVLVEDTHVVERGGVRIELSPTEFSLLRFLLRNQGRVVSRSQILEAVWGYDFDADTGVVETYVSYLRRKVDDAEHKLIHTVRGFGYTLRPDS